MTGAGQLRERLTFQSPTPEVDAYGGTTEGWTDEFTVPARLWPQRGGESIQADRLSGRQTFVLQVWSDEDTRTIEPQWRAVDANDTSRIFQVKSPPIHMDERRMFLDMLVEQGVAG